MTGTNLSPVQLAGVDPTQLRGKSILLTGGASGIGLAIAETFAAAGAYVTIADVQDECTIGVQLTKKFARLGQHVNYTQCDVTDFDSQVLSFKSAINFSPHRVLDVVGLCAGVLDEPGNIMDHIVKLDLDLDKDPTLPGTRCLEVNLVGLYYSAYLALHYLRFSPQDEAERLPPGTWTRQIEAVKPPDDASKCIRTTIDSHRSSAGPLHGIQEKTPNSTKSLIVMNSMAGYIDLPKHTTYNMSKFAGRGMFRSIRGYARNWDVRCNLIAPWHIKTPMTEAIQAFMRKHDVPEGRGVNWASMKDVVHAVVNCAVNEEVDGRAFAVMPEGIYDLADDIETNSAGKEVRELMRVRVEAGDTIA